MIILNNTDIIALVILGIIIALLGMRSKLAGSGGIGGILRSLDRGEGIGGSSGGRR